MDLLDLFSVIMMTDRNEDNLVTPSEAEEFMLRIRAFAGRRGKILNEDMILEAFKRSMKNPANAHGTASMFNIVQSAMSDEIVDNTSGNAEANLSEQPTETVLKEKVGDDEFVNLQKVPRVTPTGLVVSESREEEGNLAHPIKVEDLRNAYTNDALLDTKGSLARDKTKSVIPEEDNVDIVSMILQSVSGGLGSN